jgi:hypothetical protein
MSIKRALVLLLVAALPGMAFAVDVELKFQPFTQEKSSDCCPSFSVEVKKSMEAPEGDWNLPVLKSDVPVYAMIALGDEERLLVLDQKSKDDLFYNRIFFDADNDRDLTDDPVIEEEAPGKAGDHVYDLKGISVKGAGGSYEYAFQMKVQYKGRKNKKPTESGVKRSLKLYLEPACWYRGGFDLEGRHYDLCLMDQNGNGKLNDAPVLPDLDALAAGKTLSLAGDGLFITSKGEIRPDFSLIVGDLLVLGSKTFRCEVRMGEGLLRLTPCEDADARVSLSMEAEQVGLFDPDKGRIVMIYGPGKEVFLPQGIYRLYGYRALRKDAQGDLWSLTAAATRDTPALKLEGGGAPALEFGEPFRPFGEVPEWSISGIQQGFSQQASIEFIIEGSGKERVTDFIRLTGEKTEIPLSKAEKNRPVEPRFKVMDTGGDVAAEGEFKYG